MMLKTCKRIEIVGIVPVDMITGGIDHRGGLHCCNVGGGIAPVRCSFPHT